MTSSQTGASRPEFRILVPVEDGDRQRLALDIATTFPASSVMTLFVLPSSHRPLATLVEEASTVTAGFHVTRNPEGQSDAGLIVRFGDHNGEICKCAEDFDLVVMMVDENHSAKDTTEPELIVDELAYSSKTPLFLFRASHYQNGTRLPRRIVVPLDGSEMAEESLALAARMSLTLNVPVELVHVLDLGFVPKTTDARRKTELARQAYLQARVDELEVNGVDATCILLYGSPAYSILDELSPDDVVVVASHGMTRSDRWLTGSISMLLIHRAPCPVVLVPSQYVQWRGTSRLTRPVAEHSTGPGN